MEIIALNIFHLHLIIPFHMKALSTLMILVTKICTNIIWYRMNERYVLKRHYTILSQLLVQNMSFMSFLNFSFQQMYKGITFIRLHNFSSICSFWMDNFCWDAFVTSCLLGLKFWQNRTKQNIEPVIWIAIVTDCDSNLIYPYLHSESKQQS